MTKAGWQFPTVVKCLDSGVTMFRSEYWIEHLPSYIADHVIYFFIESITPSVKWGQQYLP